MWRDTRLPDHRGQWREWPLPADGAQTYAVFVDDQDIVWASDFASGTIVRFAPATAQFTTIELPDGAGSARQFHGRPSEVWGAANGADLLFMIRGE